jgi:hypothetical protein
VECQYDSPKPSANKLVETIVGARSRYQELQATAIRQIEMDERTRRERIRNILFVPVWLGNASLCLGSLSYVNMSNGVQPTLENGGIIWINGCFAVRGIAAVAIFTYPPLKNRQEMNRVATIESKGVDAQSEAQYAYQQWLQKAKQAHQERLDEIKRLASAQGE